MIKRINKTIKLVYENRIKILPEGLKNKINIFWEECIKQNPTLFNGEDYVVEKFEENDDEIVMHVVKSDFAHYLYDERVGIKNPEYRCISPWSGVLLLTSDNYWVVGQMNKLTSFADGFQIPGGAVDKKDIKDGKIDINENLKREVKEEVNLDLDKIDYKIEFLEYPTEKRNTYGFLAIGKLDMTKAEFEKFFKEYQNYLVKNNLEVEFEKLIFFTKGKAVQEYDAYDNPKRAYMRELLEEVEKIDE